MNKKKMAPVILLLAVLAAGGAWFVLGGGESDEEEVKAAVAELAIAMAVGNKNLINNMISQNFKDVGMVYADAVEEFGRKRLGYSVEVDAVNIRENKAEVSYTRKEKKDGKQVASAVVNEIWVKENDGKWRILKLSGIDRARIKKERVQRKEQEQAILLEQERAAGVEEADEGKKFVFYSSHGKRDPFESLILEIVTEGTGAGAATVSRRCDDKRPREFLESFDLFSIKLVGILKAADFMALVETQTGNGYTVKKGMYMGRHCGKVVKITPDLIVVEEKYIRPRGDFKKKKAEIKLGQEESL